MPDPSSIIFFPNLISFPVSLIIVSVCLDPESLSLSRRPILGFGGRDRGNSRHRIPDSIRQEDREKPMIALLHSLSHTQADNTRRRDTRCPSQTRRRDGRRSIVPDCEKPVETDMQSPILTQLIHV